MATLFVFLFWYDQFPSVTPKASPTLKSGNENSKMSATASTTERVQSLLAAMQGGEADAWGRLLEVVQERFRILAHHMVRRYQRVRHLEDTDDLLQKTWLRLQQVLKTFRPESPQVFFAISAKHMRWVLIDMARSCDREQRVRIDEMVDGQVPEIQQSRESTEPITLDDWTEFHEAVEKLSEEEKEVVSLLYYQGLTQEAAADLLGVSVRTVKLRWQSAKLRLSQAVRKGE